MTLVTNSAEGQVNTTAVTAANSGGASGTAFSLVAKNGTLATFSTDHAMHGSESYKLATINASGCILGWTSYNSASGALRGYLYMPALPDVLTPFVCAVNTSSANMAVLYVYPAGNLSVRNGAGTEVLKSTSTLSAATWYRFELQVTAGASTSTGTLQAAVYAGDGATAVGDCHYSSTTTNTGTVNLGSARFGVPQAVTTANTYYIDDLAANDGATSFIGAPGVPPVAAFTFGTAARVASFDGSTSSATSPATITGYAWDYGDTGTGTGATPTHTYSAAGAYTVTLTVTDSTGLTTPVSHTVNIADATGTVTAQSVTNSANWTPSSGTALACITDGDPTTFITSQTPPTAQPLVFILQASTPSNTGQPFLVFLTADVEAASTGGTLTAVLKEGSTVRSTIPGITIPAGSGSTVLGQITVTFPWSDVSAITTGGWNNLTVELDVTAS